jgi:bacillithiol biosynthesis cysteine-adding enzyme BshC
LSVVPTEPQTMRASPAVRDAIDLRRFPWIRPLVTAYATDYSAVAPLFSGDPASADAWRETIARVQRAPRDRAAIAATIGRQLEQRQAPDAARAAAARLADPSTVAIVTGQQAGAFGGPLYTLLKAVTAIQLARRVAADHGAPVVPVFWVDEEDHDWDEVCSAWVLDQSSAAAEVRLPDVPGAGARPVRALALDERIGNTLNALEAALPPTEFTSDVLATLRRLYAAGTSVAAAFAGWIDDLLGRHGLVVVEAGDPALKPLVADLFVRELASPCRTAALARETGEAMQRLGHEPQVQPAEDSVALFYIDDHGRRAIKRRDIDFAIGDRVVPAASLRDEAAAHPERFSPNVLLRPVIQDHLFPTVCYVAGPSELAYQVQLTGIYREFGVEAPLLYSRASATIIDAGAARFLDRYQQPLESLHAQDESALNRLLEHQLPPTVEATMADVDRTIAASADALRSAVLTLDPTLAGAVDTTRDRIHDTLKSLHGKIIQAAKRKDETLRRQFNRTRALVFPAGQPQERVLSVVFFANRYGPALTDRLIELLPLEAGKHYVLTL